MTRMRSSTRDEDGITVVELMVAVSLTALVLTMVATGAIGLYRATNTIEVRTENVDHARLAVATLSRDLRAAAPPASGDPTFVVADPEHARFTARLGTGEAPVLVDVRVEGGRLIERVTPPTVDPEDGTVSYQDEDTTIRFIASHLYNAPDEPVITYGDVVDGEVVWLAGELSESQRRSIRMVRIDLLIARDEARRVAPQRIVTEVRLPNT